MTSKIVKNEQWYVKTLIDHIKNNTITKPKYQRKKKWNVQQKNEKEPNEKAYIDFLFGVKNSVHAITFGQNIDGNKKTYTNIDGNNRINAIKHFIDTPFEIFSEYLTELFIFIDSLNNLDDTVKNQLKQIFNKISYNDIIEMKFHKYFETNNLKELYIQNLKQYRDEFESQIDIIQQKFHRFPALIILNFPDK